MLSDLGVGRKGFLHPSSEMFSVSPTSWREREEQSAAEGKSQTEEEEEEPKKRASPDIGGREEAVEVGMEGK